MKFIVKKLMGQAEPNQTFVRGLSGSLAFRILLTVLLVVPLLIFAGVMYYEDSRLKAKENGGVAANDPVVLAYAELDDKEQPCLLSFGTGYVNHNIFKGKHWGALSWIVDIDQKSVSTKPRFYLCYLMPKTSCLGKSLRLF